MNARIKAWWGKFIFDCIISLPASIRYVEREVGDTKELIISLTNDMEVMKKNHETLQRNHSNLIKRLNKKHKLFAGIIENVPENITDLYSELNAFEEDITSKIDKIREDLDSQIEYNREIDRKVGELNASAGKVMSQAFRGR